MAVAYILSTAARNALSDVLGTLFDAGAGPATIKVYTGALNDLDPTGDTLLGTWTLSDPSTGAAAAGVETLSAVANAVVAANGTPGYFLIADSNGLVVMGGNVGTAATALITDTSPWVAGATIAFTSGTFTTPAS
jgi:hypothetical protein